MESWLEEDTDRIRGIMAVVLQESYGKEQARSLAFDQDLVEGVCAIVVRMHRFDTFLRYEVEDVLLACEMLLLDTEIEIAPLQPGSSPSG